MAENLAPPGFAPRTVQPVAQSLYRLSYRAHHTFMSFVLKSKYKKDLNIKKAKYKEDRIKTTNKTQATLIANRQMYWLATLHNSSPMSTSPFNFILFYQYGNKNISGTLKLVILI
jgi:hypothetical protein